MLYPGPQMGNKHVRVKTDSRAPALSSLAVRPCLSFPVCNDDRVAEGGLWVPRSVSLVLASEGRG